MTRTRDAAASDDTVEPDIDTHLGEVLELLDGFDLRFNIVDP